MPPILVLSSAKRISTRILVIAKLSGRKDYIVRGFFLRYYSSQQGITSSKLATEAQK